MVFSSFFRDERPFFFFFFFRSRSRTKAGVTLFNLLLNRERDLKQRWGRFIRVLHKEIKCQK